MFCIFVVLIAGIFFSRWHACAQKSTSATFIAPKKKKKENKKNKKQPATTTES